MKHKKLFAAFVAAITFAALSVPALAQAPNAPPQVISPEVQADRKITFRLLAPKAESVRLTGSDYPLIAPDRWLADFEKIAIRDEVRPLILKDNALRLFGFSSKE